MVVSAQVLCLTSITPPHRVRHSGLSVCVLYELYVLHYVPEDKVCRRQRAEQQTSKNK